MKHLATLALVLGLGLFMIGCGEQKKTPKPPESPTVEAPAGETATPAGEAAGAGMEEKKEEKK